ncbi:MAG: magnesium chelatase domain-containing protein, partial [Abditibacteriaceae bacterium]
NPSHIFLSEKRAQASGSVVVATVEGSRPLLVEVQALCTPSYFAAPRRAVSGADYNRVAMILAVLEKRLRQRLGDMDVFVNVVGGMRVTEPALDLGIALAIVSALTDTPLPDKVCVFGEVGLSGEVRQVRHADRRLQEAKRLGFTRMVVPRQHSKTSLTKSDEIWEANTVQDAVEYLLPSALKVSATDKSTFSKSSKDA